MGPSVNPLGSLTEQRRSSAENYSIISQQSRVKEMLFSFQPETIHEESEHKGDVSPALRRQSEPTKLLPLADASREVWLSPAGA